MYLFLYVCWWYWKWTQIFCTNHLKCCFQVFISLIYFVNKIRSYWHWFFFWKTSEKSNLCYTGGGTKCSINWLESRNFSLDLVESKSEPKWAVGLYSSVWSCSELVGWISKQSLSVMSECSFYLNIFWNLWNIFLLPSLISVPVWWYHL